MNLMSKVHSCRVCTCMELLPLSAFTSFKAFLHVVLPRKGLEGQPA